MDTVRLTALSERLRDLLGTDLRAIATGTLDGSAYDVHYLRDDLQDEYTSATLDDIYQGVVTEYLGQGWEEDRLHRLGSLEQSVFVFDGGMLLLRWHDGQFLFVTAERDLAMLEDVVRIVNEIDDDA